MIPIPNAHKCSGTGKVYPYPSIFCSMCYKPSIDLVFSDKDIAALKEAMRKKDEVIETNNR